MIASPSNNYTKHKTLMLLAILVVNFFISVFYLIGASADPSGGLQYSVYTGLITNVLLYAWYSFDRAERGTGFSRWFTISFWLFGALIMPFYLLGRRSEGKRLKVGLKMLVFSVLYLVTYFAGLYVGLRLPLPS